MCSTLTEVGYKSHGAEISIFDKFSSWNYGSSVKANANSLSFETKLNIFYELAFVPGYITKHLAVVHHLIRAPDPCYNWHCLCCCAWSREEGWGDVKDVSRPHLYWPVALDRIEVCSCISLWLIRNNSNILVPACVSVTTTAFWDSRMIYLPIKVFSYISIGALSADGPHMIIGWAANSICGGPRNCARFDPSVHFFRQWQDNG
jgi:hypothetical protein